MKKYHICLLEEDPFLAGLYAVKFEERGWQVSVAEELEEARTILAKGVQAFVLDIQGSDYDARTLIAELRAPGSEYKTLPIIILTTVHERDTIDALMRLDIDAYLLKGHFVPQEVVEKLQRLLERAVV